MTPREFLETIVRPNVNDFHANFADLRHAHNAITAVDALAAHLYTWAKANAPSALAFVADDTVYRAELAKRDQKFTLLRDIAKAQKRVHLVRGSPAVARADQVSARPIGWGEGGYGAGRYGGPDQVVVDIAHGHFEYVEIIVDEGLSFLEREMQTLGA